MPVYLRKNTSFTPSSIGNFEEENDDDYVQDPEQNFDLLPQPYRLIDKIINTLIDEAWEIVSSRENARLADANKIRAPQYQCATKIQNANNPVSICASADGNYVFAGMANGIIALESSTQNIVCSWEDNGLEISQIEACCLEEQTYILSTLDDMGVARLFAFINNQLFLLKVMNEVDGGTKMIAHKMEVSGQCDYAGIYIENSSNQEAWLEIHKLPKDMWIKELETFKETKTSEADKKPEGNEDTELMSPKSSESVKERKGHSCEATEENKAASPPPVTSSVDKSSQKFSTTQLILKIKPPITPTGCQMSSVAHTCKNIDSGDVIGSGTSHVIAQSHLELRDSVFEHMHENLLRYLPTEDKDEAVYIQPYFHFVQAGMLDKTGLEQAAQEGKPTSVAVWWTNSIHLMHYSLLKQSKDLEHKPDIVWPVSCKITATAVSPCSSYLAIGLENGNIIIWDVHFGIRKTVRNICSESHIQDIKFLDPSIATQNTNYPPYPTRTSFYVLITCGDSATYVLKIGSHYSDNSLTCIMASRDGDDESITSVFLMKDIPEILIIARRGGQVFLRDIFEDTMLCELKLPVNTQLSSPWEPVIAIGSCGQMAYIKGECEESSEDGEAVLSSGLYPFQLRSFPTLDNYWKKERDNVPFSVHTVTEDRVSALIKERISQQGLRKARMQMRWSMLRQEMDIVRQCRESAEKSAKQLDLSYDEESMPPTPLI